VKDGRRKEQDGQEGRVSPLLFTLKLTSRKRSGEGKKQLVVKVLMLLRPRLMMKTFPLKNFHQIVEGRRVLLIYLYWWD